MCGVVQKLGQKVLGLSAPNITIPTAASTAAAPVPSSDDASVVNAASDAKRRRAASAAASSTVLTSGQGATGSAATAGKTLLGA